MSKRHKGYVVGHDVHSEGHEVWKVRVKDTGSPYSGQKITVASVHGGVTLAQGLNVNFLIGTVDDKLGHKVIRAVDVRLEE